MMSILILANLIIGIMSFTLMIHDERRFYDVSVRTFLMCGIMSIIPIFNIAIAITGIVAISERHYRKGGFAFLDKTVLKKSKKSKG